MTERGVIFDMDGVLVDSYEAHYESWRRTGEDRGVHFTREQFDATFGRTSFSIIRHLTGERFSDEECRQWDRDKEALYREIVADDFPTMPGAPELLTALKKAQYGLSVGTSGPKENVQVLFSKMPGAQHFDAHVCGDDITHSKPHPEVFLKAAQKLGLAPEQCAVVEDSVHGLEAARRGGFAAIGLTGTTPLDQLQEKADLVVESLNELTPERIQTLIEGVRR